jgi:hypothetical protein
VKNRVTNLSSNLLLLFLLLLGFGVLFLRLGGGDGGRSTLDDLLGGFDRSWGDLIA